MVQFLVNEHCHTRDFGIFSICFQDYDNFICFLTILFQLPSLEKSFSSLFCSLNLVILSKMGFHLELCKILS